MRRLLACLMLSTLLISLAGCRITHLAGRCDCDGHTGPSCTYGYGVAPAVEPVPAPATMKTEPLKAMPKAEK